MKASHIIAQCAALFSLAVAEDAYLWTVGNGEVQHSSSEAQKISSELAVAILTQRRGRTDEQYVSGLGEGSLSILNQFGGYQAPLFGWDTNPAKVFISITGFQGTAASISIPPTLQIEKTSRILVDDFSATKDIGGLCEYDLSKRGVQVLYSYTTKKSSCLPREQVRDMPAVSKILSITPSAGSVKNGMKALLQELSHLSAAENIESTVLVLPSVSKLLSVERSRRAPAREEPLDLPVSSTLPEPKSDGKFPAVAASNKTHKTPSFIPVCFSSNDTCTSVTNSCSGHGSCYKAHNGCFKCKCGTTVVRENKDGSKKTVQWGGNACQKKDISVPFIMFASLGVLLTTLVAGGIGLLYSMGSQDLPSVLGAGVAGPRAQK